MLFTILTIAGIGAIGLLGGMMADDTYGSRLEEYIVSQNPQNTYDVERLAKEYNKQNSEGFL